MKFKLLFFVLSGLIVNGCTTTPSAKVISQTEESSQINVTPLTVFSEQKIKKEDTTALSNFYTRIFITSNLASKNGQKNIPNKLLDKLKYQKRNIFKRYFWGQKFDINLSAHIKIGNYETTAPLLTISHQSNSDGEQWSRVVSHELLDFPLFLVKENGGSSIPVVNFVLSGSKEQSSVMAGTALNVAITAIKQVSPEAAVLTKLTSQSIKNKARAIDDAIGKLFSNGLKEGHIAHQDLRNWNGDGGVSIALKIPKNEGDWDAEKLFDVGTWTVSFDKPRPSILGLIP